MSEDFKLSGEPDVTRTLIWPEVWPPGTRYVVVKEGNNYRLVIDTRPLADTKP